MKRLALALILLIVPSLHAQTATLTTPEIVSRLVVAEVVITPDEVRVSLEYRTAGDAPRRRAVFTTSSQAEYASFFAATGSARSGEGGSGPRKYQFRVLGWLADNAKIKDEAGNALAVTLAP